MKETSIRTRNDETLVGTRNMCAGIDRIIEMKETKTGGKK